MQRHQGENLKGIHRNLMKRLGWLERISLQRPDKDKGAIHVAGG
jgi:hypothetical protein